MAALENSSGGQDRSSSAQGISEPTSSAVISYDILRLLDASPSLLFDLVCGEDDGSADGDIFEWFLLCMTSPDDEILRRACNVARRLFSGPRALDELRAHERLKSLSLKEEFWRRRYPSDH